LNKQNFSAEIIQEPNGEKVTTVKLKQLKLFMRIDIFMQVQKFFTQAFPKYDENDEDKPNLYNFDPGAAARNDTHVDLEDALICFESNGDHN